MTARLEEALRERHLAPCLPDPPCPLPRRADSPPWGGANAERGVCSGRPHHAHVGPLLPGIPDRVHDGVRELPRRAGVLSQGPLAHTEDLRRVLEQLRNLHEALPAPLRKSPVFRAAVESCEHCRLRNRLPEPGCPQIQLLVLRRGCGLVKEVEHGLCPMGLSLRVLQTGMCGRSGVLRLQRRCTVFIGRERDDVATELRRAEELIRHWAPNRERRRVRHETHATSSRPPPAEVGTHPVPEHEPEVATEQSSPFLRVALHLPTVLQHFLAEAAEDRKAGALWNLDVDHLKGHAKHLWQQHAAPVVELAADAPDLILNRLQSLVKVHRTVCACRSRALIGH
mmetsp:Transcript_21581/g.51519  ORF Transcript_21581/g.51519 Transcript_21581/m.51519 type:complete len:340 (+) Transcript_21581:130-1149(+)